MWHLLFTEQCISTAEGGIYWHIDHHLLQVHIHSSAEHTCITFVHNTKEYYIDVLFIHENIWHLPSMIRVSALKHTCMISQSIILGNKHNTLVSIPVPVCSQILTKYWPSNASGFWYLHCHMDAHLVEGMALVIKEGHHNQHPKPPKGFPTCGDFTWSLDEFKDIGKNSKGLLELTQISMDGEETVIL